MATRGLRCTLRYFCRLMVCANRSSSPSQSNHIGLTCTEPSGRVVAKCPYSGRSTRSSYPTGTAAIFAPARSVVGGLVEDDREADDLAVTHAEVVRQDNLVGQVGPVERAVV